MFDFSILAPEHLKILDTLVPGQLNWVLRKPLGLPATFAVRSEAAEFQVAKFRRWDLEIAPDGKPYIYRWHLIPRNEVGANVYLHLQVADDPERPLHDHPWDNQSVILAGGYREVYLPAHFVAQAHEPWEREVRTGRVIHRRAEEAHRIFLLPDCPYTISLFTTGPVVRDWGFWFDSGWRSHKEVIVDTGDGRSVFKDPTHG